MRRTCDWVTELNARPVPGGLRGAKAEEGLALSCLFSSSSLGVLHLQTWPWPGTILWAFLRLQQIPGP